MSLTSYPYETPPWLQPKEDCPYCSRRCVADFVDIGVGFQQCGPFHCTSCGASQISPYAGDDRELTEREIDTGWYEPGSPPDALANTNDSGELITHYEADTLYRAEHGVEPRYDRHGKFIDK